MNRLAALAAREERLVIGLMSGTSVDGIDAALVRIRGGGSGVSVRLERFATYPWDPAVRDEIFALFRPESSNVARLCRMNFVIGEAFARAALRLAADAGIPIGEVDLIGSHGQTVWHDPAGEPRSTLQIGEPAVISEATGAVVVADFRVRDVAAGGQGAPLVPYADYCLLRHDRLNRAVQNIGGIANVTYLPAGCGVTQVLAFDTGPGNMIMDALCAEHFGRPYDEGGAIAASGRVDSTLLGELMNHHYLAEAPPKTTGRELFGVQFARTLARRAQPADLVATATAFTARSIADSYRRFLGPVDEVIVSGGGARNPILMQMLSQALPGVRVMPSEGVGIDADAKEAVAFALLANDAILGLTTNIPGATGGRPAVLGKVQL